MVRGCTSKQRLNDSQKYNVNYHFASHAPINMKTLILEGIHMTTTISLKLCNHLLRNIIIVSHDATRLLYKILNVDIKLLKLLKPNVSM